MSIYTPSKSSDSSGEPCRMDVVYFSNEYPTEDLEALFRRLHKLSKDKSHLLLAQFINEATSAIKDEIRQLPAELKRLISPFKTVLDWAEDKELRSGLICGTVDGVLLAIVQLATYIGYAESHPQDLHDCTNISLAGLGIGLLASTGVALSSRLADLPLAGADAVRLTFRMGIHVMGVSENLQARDPSGSPDTWAYLLHNVDAAAVQRELDITNQQDVPETGKIFVSAISRASVTISGPPSRLKSLFDKSEFFRRSTFFELPVYGGLCHAPHIYGSHDSHSIVKNGRPLNTFNMDFRPAMPLYSTSTGDAYAATTASVLFENVILELLTQTVCWDNVIGRLVDKFKCDASSEVVLHCFGNSIPLNDLNTALKNTVPDVDVSINNLVNWVAQIAAEETTPHGPAQSKLAIVGMSCRLPGGATNTEKFWEILEKGLDVSRTIPADRFDVETHYDPTGKQPNKSMTKYGCFIDEPGLFDGPFFNMSPREAQVVDPQMRLALVTAYEALERSGYVGNRTSATQLQRIGTWYGQASDDYREVNQSQDISTYYIPGGCRAFGPGRINYFFKFAGPSYCIDTACSSGLAAIEVACQALWNGEVDTAVAGGVNILTNPDCFAGLCKGHFLTKGHNACKTWDATADGYCRADGIGSLVVKRLEDAEADNDNILGVILSAGTNHSADSVSITHPHAGNQAYLSRQVLRQASVNPLDVSYVELHGTGTQAGDYEEMQGIMAVYAPLATKRRSKDQPLYIGAVKANVGHGEAVAGTTSLIKVLLMLQKNAIPPHIGIKTEINPQFSQDFDKRNLSIAFEKTTWPQVPGKKRIVAINNFGAAGGNTTMILEEAPVRVITETDPRQTHAITVSAKSKASLVGNIERLLSHLDVNSSVNLADLSYTTTARRYHHNYRVAITTSDISHLKKQLQARLSKVDAIKAVKGSHNPPIAFSFTGQGASYKSMDLELYHDVPTFRKHIQYLDSLARAQGFPSFLPALDGSHPKDYEHSPVVTQLALVCMEIALAKYWASLGVKPDVVIGHSLGEYAAMHIAGVVTASDTIFMVGRRAQMLQERCQIGSHSMIAVRAPLEQIIKICEDKPYTISCVNGPSDIVLSGTKEQMDEIVSPLEASGYRCIKLNIAFAFHSEQTDPILDDFETVSKNVFFQEPRLPVISPLLGRVVFDAKTLNAEYVRRATREPVNFLSGLENALMTDTVSDETVWIEIGPHPVCTGFIKSIIPSARLAVPSLHRGESNWKTFAESLAALHLVWGGIDWNEFHSPMERRLRLLDLPTYAFNEKNYWLQYNGDWCLTKGNEFYTEDGSRNALKGTLANKFHTTTVQQIIAEDINGSAGSVTTQSDLMQKDFLAATNGHQMNDCGVVTSSIHADIAYTLGSYLYRKFYPENKDIGMNITNLVVTKGLVAKKDKTPQLIQVTASTTDVHSNIIDLTWRNVDNNGHIHEPFAAANILYGNALEWLSSWTPIAHLVNERIKSLESLAADGIASRFSHKMAYNLFANNLVDYSEKYRGMRSVVMHELEAFADVQLSTMESGVWTIPPHFIDSLIHLAGFIMNCSDAMDTKNKFCVTPGWKSMQFAKPLVPGSKYRSYVKMIATVEDPTIYLGDLYILHENVIIGKVGGMQFRQYPRILLSRFFSPPKKMATLEASKSNNKLKQVPVSKPFMCPSKLEKTVVGSVSYSDCDDKPVSVNSASSPTAAKPINIAETPVASTSNNSITGRALNLIAREAGLELSDLEDDANFVDLGIDSLLSLVLSEKFRTEFDINVSGSLFLDYPSIGDLRKWLEEYYG